jgi:hypothetical protein
MLKQKYQLLLEESGWFVHSSLNTNCCKAAFRAGNQEAISAMTSTVKATNRKSDSTILTGK